MALVANYDSCSSEHSDGDEIVEPSSLGANKMIPKVSSTHAQVDDCSIDNGEKVLEDCVKKVDYGQNIVPLPKALVHPDLSDMRLSSGKKGKVQISIPSLQSADSDEEDVPVTKKAKTCKGLLGMLSSLPTPKNSLGGKEIGRSLLPQSVSKKPASQKMIPKQTTKLTAKVTTKPSNGNSILKEQYSDSDDDVDSTKHSMPSSTSYFSFDSSVPSSSTQTHLSSSGLSTVNPVVDTFANQPLLFSAQSASNIYNHSVSTSQQIYVNETTEVENSDVQETRYNTYYEPDPPTVDQGDSSQDINALLQDEEFLKFQGRRRGKEEISIIDVHCDDQKTSELELTKHLSEEKPSSSVGKKIGGQSKRKHQITYLAYQAKAMEQDLKNAWANNRHSRMQSRSKYGF